MKLEWLVDPSGPEVKLSSLLLSSLLSSLLLFSLLMNADYLITGGIYAGRCGAHW
jgi:hypothetical protein